MFRRLHMHSIITIVMVVILSSFAVTGCDQVVQKATPVSTESKTTAPKSTAQPVEASALKLGESGRTDTFEITVTSVVKPTEWTKDVPAGHEYIVVTIQVTNITKEEASISASDFGCVKDESGNRGSWENYTGIKTEPDTFGGEDITPGDTFAGSLIFAIPVDMSVTELHYTKGYALKPNLRFEITK
ncbi:MAG: DUF4352 domain-containing protein [Anaerolineae bacterium]